jgi:predicted PurR-regulated permease PerM
MQFTRTQLKGLAWLGIAFVCLLVLWLLGPVLIPFTVGAILAYALHPLVDKLHDRLWPRALAVLAVELGLILLLIGLFLLIVPIVIQEVPLIREQLPGLFEKLNSLLSPLLAQLGLKADFDLNRLRELMGQYLNTHSGSAVGALVSSLKLGGGFALTVVGSLLLIPVALFFFLLDWIVFVDRVREFIPPHLRSKVDGFLTETDEVLSQYLRGQIMVMVLMSSYYACGLALFGLDLALPIGLFTGLAMFIPYVGFGIGLVLALMAGLLEFQSATAFAMVAVVYGSGQLLEGLWLTPKLVGKRIGLHPLAVIFALLAFGQLFGFVGVLVALPASAITLVAFRRIKAAYLGSDLYKGV